MPPRGEGRHMQALLRPSGSDAEEAVASRWLGRNLGNLVSAGTGPSAWTAGLFPQRHSKVHLPARLKRPGWKTLVEPSAATNPAAPQGNTAGTLRKHGDLDPHRGLREEKRYAGLATDSARPCPARERSEKTEEGANSFARP